MPSAEPLRDGGKSHSMGSASTGRGIYVNAGTCVPATRLLLGRGTWPGKRA